MHILVDRMHSDQDATLSAVHVDGEFVCFGLEDEFREHKIPSETRIPAGTYNVTMRTVGGFDSRYKKKFDFHKGMLQVANVPNFKYVLVHIGNTERDTAGCLLVGLGARAGKVASVQSSVDAYKKLYQLVAGACLRRELTIEYRDSDRA